MRSRDLANPFLAPTTPTLADVFDRLTEVTLSPTRLRDCQSALRRLSEITGEPLSVIPAEAQVVRQKLEAAAPALALGEGCGATSSLHRTLSSPSEPRRVRRKMPLEDLDIADHNGEQVVKVVSDAAGQLPDRLHLLSLPESLLVAVVWRKLVGAEAVP